MKSIIHLLEPKKFKVSSFALMGLFKYRKEQLEIKDIWSSNNNIGYSLNEILAKITEKLDDVLESNCDNLLLPIFCLDIVNPIFEGVRAFLSQTMPNSLKHEVQSLKLHKSVEASFATGKKETGALSITILDFSSQRLLIIGKSEKAVSQLKSLISIFHFPEKDRRSLANDLHETFSSYVLRPLGTRMLIGGFATIYAFLSAFLVNECLGMSLSFGELFSFILCLFSIICFLTFEVFENKIIAFSPKWNIVIKIISWFSFIIILFVSPFILFGEVPISFLLPIFRILSCVVIISCFICSMGDIFFETGITKKRVLILWFFFVSSILLLPVL